MQSLQEYAREAGISPRAARARINRGDVAARKIGGVWIVSGDGRRAPRQGAGRRLSALSFDRLADHLDGVDGHLSADERRRARQRGHRIAQRGLEQVRVFAQRPDLEVRTFTAGREDLQELMSDVRLHRTGIMHPSAEVYGPMVDAYVCPADAEEIELFHLLQPVPAVEANVRLRVQDPPPQIRRLHVIADLLDDASPRSRAEAQRLLVELIGDRDGA